MRHRLHFYNIIIPKFFRHSRHRAWWLGGIGVICLYIWVFYSFFVGPTGFRWRALYGDANYPQGYSIHGFNKSHNRAIIDWDSLSKAMVAGNRRSFFIIKRTKGTPSPDENSKNNSFQAGGYGFKLVVYNF